ncbi:hypothetical protein [Streptomyces canus]|uniref:hypothetical protein n=1 Tax=Streptomyces canus TaxID=58343 RepID=UPI003722C43F
MWQRKVTRWASVLAVLSLVLLGAAVLSLRGGDLAGNLVNTVVAGANVAFVIFTWAVFKAGQEQIAQMRTDYAHAEKAFSEAVRTRLDQLAPRVSVSYDRWEAALERDGRDNTLQPGSVVADGQTVRVTTHWVVKNWGLDPVVVKYPDMPEAPYRLRLPPGGDQAFSCVERRTVTDWKAADGRWTCQVEVIAEDLGFTVRDEHRWDGELRPFTVSGERLVVADPGLPRGVVARRQRFYPSSDSSA